MSDTRQSAFEILGLAETNSEAAVRDAYNQIYSDLHIRLANAPTAALRKKYQSNLEELRRAYDLLTTGSSSTSHDDLPSSGPLYGGEARGNDPQRGGNRSVPSPPIPVAAEPVRSPYGRLALVAGVAAITLLVALIVIAVLVVLPRFSRSANVGSPASPGSTLHRTQTSSVQNIPSDARTPQVELPHEVPRPKGREQAPLSNGRKPAAAEAAANAATNPSPARPASAPSAAEAELWSSIKNEADPSYFEEYLKRYPAGFFAEVAEMKLKKLKPQPESVPTPSADAAPRTIAFSIADPTTAAAVRSATDVLEPLGISVAVDAAHAHYVAAVNVRSAAAVPVEIRGVRLLSCNCNVRILLNAADGSSRSSDFPGSATGQTEAIACSEAIRKAVTVGIRSIADAVRKDTQ